MDRRAPKRQSPIIFVFASAKAIRETITNAREKHAGGSPQCPCRPYGFATWADAVNQGGGA